MVFLPIYLFESYPPSHSNSNAVSQADYSSPRYFPSLLNTSYIYIWIWWYIFGHTRFTRAFSCMWNINCTLSNILYKCYLLLFGLLLFLSSLISQLTFFLYVFFMESLTTWVQTPKEQDLGHKYLHDSSPRHLIVPYPECSSIRSWVNEWWMHTVV